MLENNLFWDMLGGISIILELYVCKKIFDYISERKYKNRIANLSMVLVILLILFLIEVNIEEMLIVFMSIVATMIFYITNYKVDIVRAGMTATIYLMATIESNALSMIIVTLINSLSNVEVFFINSIYKLEIIVLSKFILIFMLYLYKEIIPKIELDNKNISYLAIPIITNIGSFLYIFEYLFKTSEIVIIDSYEVIFILIVLCISNTSIVLIIKRIKDNDILLDQKYSLEKKLKMQHEYYMKIKENQDKIMELHYNIKDDISYISKFNEDKSTRESNTYEIEEGNKKYENIFNTGNVLLDIILKYKKQVCNNKGIELTGSISFVKCDFIEQQDISIIFSNILDNAIEACDKIREVNKFIVIEGKVIKDIFIIKVENSKLNKINIENNKFITDKDSSYYHGIGINNIKNSVKKYNGKTIINYTNDNFTIEILIPIPNEI